MAKSTATTVAPPEAPTSRGAYTEQLHVMVDVPTREYVIGAAATAARERGYKFLRQSEIIRDLIYRGLAAAYEDDQKAYAEAVILGRQLSAERPEGSAPRRA